MNIRFFSNKGFDKTEKLLQKYMSKSYMNILKKYGELGVIALSESTPKNSGTTASSWAYRLEGDSSGAAIIYYNTNLNKGFNVAVGIQYGHGTGTGGWVSGIDYINPATLEVFENLVVDLWKEVALDG